MADFAAPSFSLGIDFDDPPARPPAAPRGGDKPLADSEEEGPWCRPEEEPPKEAPLLRRLRRGPRAGAGGSGPSERTDLDDDIEDFSSNEDRGARDEFPSQKYNSVCSSSKLSLHELRILTTQSSSKVNTQNNTFGSNGPWSKDLESSGNKKMLPKLTISPLRKIQLLDSDSDDPSPQTRQESDCCQVKKSCLASQVFTNAKMKAKLSDVDKSSESLWNDFDTKSVSLATPAFDEFCKEYGSLKYTDHTFGERGPSNPSVSDTHLHASSCPGPIDFNDSVGISGNSLYQWSTSDPQPPAYRYFFHDDMRIQKLVRERLLNFVPLGVANHRQQISEMETFDYKGQFGSQKACVKPSRTGETSRKRKCSNRKGQNAAVVDDSLPSENWVSPRSCMTYPKDAGRRRVHVESHSSGHWYTQGGKKVYINKNGEELSGQSAYRCYRRETGGGFKRGKKKDAAKKKGKK